jgi:ATP-binding cassette subfamily B protein
MREILCGLPVIRAFSNENHEKERFDKVNTALTKNSLFVGRVMTFMMPALMLIMNLVAILIVWVGADRINTGTMQVGDIMAFIQYTMQIIMSFLMMTMISIILPRAAISVGRINEVLKEEPTIHDPAEEETIDPNKNGLLEFRNVSFSYPNAEEDVLSDISFIAKPGEVTAIIGSTGSGKSTLVNLIPRFYDVTEGEILINGTDIRNISQYNLRKRLGYVPQKGVLFSGTIESNISFGMPEASTETIKKAARIAQAAEFIEEKPEGYKEPIAQGGSNVSGGQKQRLSIARAIAKNPEIYIFDDSFSALDYKTDSELRKALKKELSHSTVIIVAQRISTIVNADQILVLDNGKIVGKGTHKELLKDCEVYRQIASSQLSKEELAYE